MVQSVVPLVVGSFNEFLPSSLIDQLGSATAVWVAFWVIVDLARWRRTAIAPISAALTISYKSTVKTLAVTVAKDGLYQRDVFACGRARWLTHFAIFWGFVLLMVTTTLSWLTNPQIAPMTISNPVRILGNVGGVLLVFGLVLAVGRRLLVSEVRTTSGFSDALFLFLIAATATTGFLVEVTNQWSTYAFTYSIYMMHLYFVALLLGTAPFTKFIHVVGRFLMAFTESLSQRR